MVNNTAVGKVHLNQTNKRKKILSTLFLTNCKFINKLKIYFGSRKRCKGGGVVCGTHLVCDVKNDILFEQMHHLKKTRVALFQKTRATLKHVSK